MKKRESEDNYTNPSIAAGITPSRYEKDKLFYCKFISSLSSSLKSRLPTKATALVLFHKFYALQSITEHNPVYVSYACLFTAGKIEEDLKKLKDILKAGESFRFQKNVSFEGEEGEKEFNELVDHVLLCERILLHTLSFEVNQQHPHNSLYSLSNHFLAAHKLIQKIKGGPKMQSDSWKFLNDTLHTELCLKYDPDQIGVAGVVLAAYKLLDDSSSGKLELKEEEKSACTLICEQYETDGTVEGIESQVIAKIVKQLNRTYELSAAA
eukprot:maker-scaffold_4-snap-gene-12.2-mRNA-1 protein AED:0.33 eAED:0.33 QI:81/1/1/1/1/1/2/56/266